MTEQERQQILVEMQVWDKLHKEQERAERFKSVAITLGLVIVVIALHTYAPHMFWAIWPWYEGDGQ